MIKKGAGCKICTLLIFNKFNPGLIFPNKCLIIFIIFNVIVVQQMVTRPRRLYRQTNRKTQNA
jgi:hypothetical protein